MTTVTDVTTPPHAGLLHIDALLDEGPGWNFLAPARTTLRYTFALDDPNDTDAGRVYSGTLVAFTATQQQAVLQALAAATTVTGIRFELAASASDADLHFSAANLVGSNTTGYASTTWNYRFDGRNVITSYTADAWIYLDNVEWATQNANPQRGGDGYETLLHEVGHALGLKHPFEGDTRLPAGDDHTGNTLMSYTDRGGTRADYSPYDLAALGFLYGGDGLGGALGIGSAGLLFTGTSGADTLRGGPGDDRLAGIGGIDTVVYTQPRASYTISRAGSDWVMAGPDGRDTLAQVERVTFADRQLALDLDGAAGQTARILGAVFGPSSVANRAFVAIGLDLFDRATPTAAVLQLALDARLGRGFTNEALVDALYTNLVGSAPSAADRAFWVGTLTSGQFNALTLTQMAVDLDLNAQNIGLTGLATTGLEFG